MGLAPPLKGAIAPVTHLTPFRKPFIGAQCGISTPIPGGMIPILISICLNLVGKNTTES